MSTDSVGPIKNAIRREFVIRNYLSIHNLHETLQVRACAETWNLTITRNRDQIFCSFQSVFSDVNGFELETRVVLVNHLDSAKSYGIFKKYNTCSNPSGLYRELLCSHQYVIDNQLEYLKNGDLKVNFDFRVDFIIGKEEFRRINFFDPLPDEDWVSIESDYYYNQLADKLYIRKTMLLIHSPVIASILESGKNEITLTNCNYETVPCLYEVLQVLHGVPCRPLFWNALEMVRIAQEYKMKHVLMNIDRMTVRASNTYSFYISLTFDLQNFNKKYINEAASAKELRAKYCYSRDKLPSAPLEIRKILVAKFFSFAVLPLSKLTRGRLSIDIKPVGVDPMTSETRLERNSNE